MTKSPCPTCKNWRKDKDECSLYCQGRVDYLHQAFGEPWYDTEALKAKQKEEMILLRRLVQKCNFSDPTSPKARHLVCPICGAEVWTSHAKQKTCGKGRCPKVYDAQRDAERRARQKQEKLAA